MELTEWLIWAIGPGSGIVIKVVLDWLIGELVDDGHSPSPKTRRRLSYLVSLSLPSIIIALLILLGHPYSLTEHLTAILAAFGISQVVHGETSLKTGAEQRVDSLLAVPDAVSAAVVRDAPMQTPQPSFDPAGRVVEVVNEEEGQ